MKNKSLITKIIIYAVLIILIIWICIKIISSISNYLNRDKIDEIVPEIQEQINNAKGKIQLVATPNELYQVRSCLLKYYLNYSAMFGKNTITDLGEEYNIEDYKKSTFNMLAPKYTSKNNISIENINKNDENVIMEPEIEIYKIYSLSNFEGLAAYFVNGKVRDSITHLGNDINAIVVLDDINQTFEIYFSDYTELTDYSTFNLDTQINFELPKVVENRESNKTALTSSKYEDISRDYFGMIRRLLLDDVEIAYDLLTTEMKQKYPTYESFQSFVDSNYKTLFLLEYGTYKLKNNDGNIAFKTYSMDNSISITIYFDGFSTFQFDIEGI